MDLVQPEIAPFDPPTSKPYPRTKDEVNRMTVAEIWPFEIFQNARSVCRRVGRSVDRLSVLNITLFSYTPLRYVRNVAREE